MLKCFGSVRNLWLYNRFNIMPIEFQSIGTHNGTFHCDEALGCFLLKIINNGAEIIRSRDQAVLNKCDIVIDVGDAFDPEKLRFDHHQKGFQHTMNSLRSDMPYHIKLSSAGLIYCHFGEKIIEKVLGVVDKEAFPHIYKKVYESFILEIDGIDNGVEMCQGDRMYSINTNLSKRVAHLNKRWNHKGNFDEDSAFHKAMDLTGGEFLETVNFTYNAWWPARKIVKDAIDERYQVHKSGEIIQFSEWLPFIEHLLCLEKDMKVEPTIKYAIYKDGDMWRIRAVPVSESSFKSRVPLLKSWCGLRHEQLVEAGAPEGVIFVHNTGFIGGHKQKEGAIEMAVKSLAATE